MVVRGIRFREVPRLIRNAVEDDIEEIERMVADFVKGRPAEFHTRSPQAIPAKELGLQPADR
jgi:hypothetical protein